MENKIPYRKVVSHLIQPYNLYIEDEEAQKTFLAFFKNDENSLIFFRALYRYCCIKNEGRWPEEISREIWLKEIHPMMKPRKVDIIETILFKEGYIIELSSGAFELTHELVALSNLTFSNGDPLPLQTGHFDFNKINRLPALLQSIGIKEPQAVEFLTKVVEYAGTQNGLLLNRKLSVEELLKITKDNGLIFDLCEGWAVRHNLAIFDAENGSTFNGLFWLAYTVMPRTSWN